MTAAVYYPRVEAWIRNAARVEQADIEAAQDRLATVQAYLAERARRRDRVEVEQFAFDFG